MRNSQFLKRIAKLSQEILQQLITLFVANPHKQVQNDVGYILKQQYNVPLTQVWGIERRASSETASSCLPAVGRQTGGYK